jgi:hypothetical protein
MQWKAEGYLNFPCKVIVYNIEGISDAMPRLKIFGTCNTKIDDLLHIRRERKAL